MSVDYLTITTSGHTAINRRLFEEVAKRGFKVAHIFPEKLIFPGKEMPFEPITNTLVQNFPLAMKGSNPRLATFEGMEAIIQKLSPKYIFVEFDPASLMVRKLTNKFGKQSKIICQSCENLSITPWANAKREGLKGFLLGLIKSTLALLNRKRIHHVFVLSTDGLNVFKQLGYKNVSVSHIGFDEQVFFQNAEARQFYRNKLNLNQPTIAYFGRIIEEKGLHVLIQALGKIKDLKWQFLMDSFSRYETDYIKKVNALIKEQKIDDRLVLFDANHTEIANYMNASDVCVVPSQTTRKWKEQYGRVAPESMACGNAIVVSSSGALKEIVDNGGIIFDESSLDDLVKMLRDLVTNEQYLNQQKAKALLRAEKYNLTEQVNDLIELK